MHKEEEQILAAMGVALLSVQMVEKILRVVITYIFQRESGLTLESLLKQEKEEARRAAGYFVKELRKRVSILESFDTDLSRFLEMRNDFVHDVSRITGFHTSSQEGRAVATKFINELLAVSHRVTKVLFALGRAWQKENNWYIEGVDNHIFTQEADELIPHVDDIFYKKEEQSD